MLQHVGLSWIIDNNNHLGFDIDQNCDKWMLNVPAYNTIILYQISSHNLEEYFTTGKKDGYELLFLQKIHI